MYAPVIITEDNIQQALEENLLLILRELEYKMPIRGIAVLQGDLSFNNMYTVVGVLPIGPNAAFCTNPRIVS